jgi:quinol monooxygenase YgiN
VITEIALFTAIPGKEEELGQGILKGLDVIRQHPGCVSARVQRCIEHPNQYMLTNVWTSFDAHMKDFRNGPLFPQWRSHINGLFEGTPSVLHYEPF